ncbi:hypothetical protein [Caenimonas koreensis]|uniref:hypothetical protein n=1 Tax=Caenimonas koreensis TaxID=367474 RepID=UPI0037842BB1
MLDEPLGLTVHTLPAPQEAATADSKRTAVGRLKMLLVLAVCAAPVIASYFTYYVVRPNTKSNYGELVEPQRPLPALTGTTLDGRQIALPSLRGQWLLVSVAGGACNSLCERNLYLQRQLREGLGKEKDRVDWVWLVPDDAPVRPELTPALAQATVLRVDGAQLRQWLSPAAGHTLEDHLFMVDPMGNWMMRFPALQGASVDVTAARNMKRDVERLLRASASWDQPGRSSK